MDISFKVFSVLLFMASNAAGGGSALHSTLGQGSGELPSPGPPSRPAPVRGPMADWEISPPMPAGETDLRDAGYPSSFQLFRVPWQRFSSDESGLVDLSGYHERAAPGPELIIARTTFFVPEARRERLSFGYSDEIALFVNKARVYHGHAAHRPRDVSVPDAVSLDHDVHVYLNAGLNEVLALVKDSTASWRFRFSVDGGLEEMDREPHRLSRVWETEGVFQVPESVLYDEVRDVLYVSSYNRLSSASAGLGFLSRITTDGQILDLKWVEGLDGPCGMGLFGDRLFVAESTGHLVEIAVGSGEILARHRITGSGFLNDIAVDGNGDIYISDTSYPVGPGGAVHRFREGKAEVWMAGAEIDRPNGLLIRDGQLLVGSSGDCLLKAVDLRTKAVRDVVGLGGRIIDGIRADGEGNLLVTLWEGEAILLDASGRPVEILNVGGGGGNLADAEYVLARRLLVIPTFYGNTVAAYRLEY